MGRVLPPETSEAVRADRAAGMTIEAIARKYQIGKGTASEHSRGVVGATAARRACAAADPVRDERERQEAEARRREHLDAVRELAFRDKLAAELAKHAAAVEPPPRYRPAKAPKGAVRETLLLHLSDWHAYEVVKPGAVFGLNDYDAAAVARRVRRVVASTLEIKTRLESGGYRFPALVVAANGDMVSGTIHEVERHTDAGNIVKAALGCASLLAGAVRDLSGAFERVYCFGTAGNHGRLPDARKAQTKDPTRSWDYLIYEYARLALRDCPGVSFEVPDAWAVMYDVEGKLFYQGHGHFVKSWNSIPFYGISRMTSRLGAVLSKHYRPVDYWLFGHFHVHGSIENAGGEYLVNPPLVGPQEFGVHGFGDAVPPGQTLYGVHPKYGLTHRWRLHAEDDWPPAGRGLGVTQVRAGAEPRPR